MEPAGVPERNVGPIVSIYTGRIVQEIDGFLRKGNYFRSFCK